MVALLGTGIMGAAMARSMRRAGLDVRAWNRSADKAEPLRADGVTVCRTAREAVQGEDVVVTMLYDADSVLEVMGSVADVVQGVWLQMSTVGVEGTDRVADLADRAGLDLLDAPVVGTKAPAEQGSLVVLVAGDRRHEGRVQPVLEAVGSRTLWVGDRPGEASALKLVVNSWVGSINAAAGQAIALAQGLGLDPRLFLDAVSGGPTDTPYLQLKGAKMIGRDYATAFGLDNTRKDIDLISAAAERAGTDTTLLAALQTVYARASDRGHGPDDMSAVVEGFRSGKDRQG